MGTAPEEQIAAFKQFLTEFSALHPNPIAEEDAMPFRINTFRMAEDEVEGECMDWVLEYLQDRNHAPPVLAAAIARHIADKVLAENLDTYLEEKLVEQPQWEGEEPVADEQLLDAMKLSRHVLSMVHETCVKWKAELPPIKPPTIPIYSIHAIKNTRRKMEDKHVIIPDLNTLFNFKDSKTRGFYAVYDGHGGIEAANFTAAHLHCHVVKQPEFKEDPSSALAKGFRAVDDAFIMKAKREGLRSGTTGVVALLEPDAVHIAWLGDSQVMLLKDGLPEVVMEPHKPERPDEKKRVEDMGGFVVWFGAWRVNGSLAVSRSIGDPDHKPYVSNETDTKTIPLDGTEECIILACDGLWDSTKRNKVARTVRDFIATEEPLDGISIKLVEHARSSGSNDNITVLVVFLNAKHLKESVERIKREGEPEDEDEEKKEEEEDESMEDDKPESERQSDSSNLTNSTPDTTASPEGQHAQTESAAEGGPCDSTVNSNANNNNNGHLSPQQGGADSTLGADSSVQMEAESSRKHQQPNWSSLDSTSSFHSSESFTDSKS
ncbi:protein phosphatase 1F-like isoform X2 [Amphiura filiformis]